MAITSGKKIVAFNFPKGQQMAGSHSKHKCNSSQEKYSIVALWKLLCAVIWKDLMEVGAEEVRRFPWSLKCKGSLNSSCIPLETAAGAKSRSCIVASLGQGKNLSSAPSLWEQDQNRTRGGGDWRLGLVHWPAYSWFPLRKKGLCKPWWKGKLWIPLQILWFNFLLLFSVIGGLWSCHLNRCSAALQTENEKAVCFLSGTKQVLAGSCSCALLPEHSRIPVMLIPGWGEGQRVKGCCLSQEPS